MSAIPGLAILVALALLGATPTALAAPIERPAWRAGDFWTYRTNTTLTDGLTYSLTLYGNATSTVTGTRATMTGSVSVNAFDVLLAASGTTTGTATTPNGTVSFRGQWTLTGDERFEPVNLHPIYNLIDVSVNGTATYGVPLPFSLRVQNTTTYTILADGWSYPMVPGTSGNVTESYAFTQDIYSFTGKHLHENGTGQWILRFSLADATSVRTPAGAFQAYPLRIDAPDGTWQRLLASPSVGNYAGTESYDAGGNLTAATSLVSYRYQALEPAMFLGLTGLGWALVAVIAATAVTGSLVILRRRRRRTPPRDQDPAGPDATSGPRGP